MNIIRRSPGSKAPSSLDLGRSYIYGQVEQLGQLELCLSHG
jgi:hypothetical protein